MVLILVIGAFCHPVLLCGFFPTTNRHFSKPATTFCHRPDTLSLRKEVIIACWDWIAVTASAMALCVLLMQCYFSQEGLKPLNSTGASAEGSFTNIAMSGQDVFRFAVRAVPSVRHLSHLCHMSVCVSFAHWQNTAELLLHDTSNKSCVLLRCDHAGSAKQWHMSTSDCCCSTLLLAFIQPGSLL